MFESSDASRTFFLVAPLARFRVEMQGWRDREGGRRSPAGRGGGPSSIPFSLSFHVKGIPTSLLPKTIRT